MRLAALSVPYRVVENGIRLLGIVVFSILTTASADAGLLGVPILFVLVAAGIALVVGWELARHRRFAYELTDDTFDIRSGVVSRREREIPYARIQNVDIAQNVLQRALDLAEVRIETAGGSGTEARLRYVDGSEAARLQEAISERKRGAEPDQPATPEETLFALSEHEHLVLGVVSADLRLLGLVSIALSAFAPRLAREIGPGFDLVSVFGPLVALGGLVAFWVLSGVLAVFRYYGFELRRRGEELRYDRGLLQRYSGSIPLAKVQTVTVRENVLARAVGYASVVVQTAGYAPGQEGSQAESAVPIARRERALALARTVEPFGDLDFQRPPKRARTRYAARYALVVLGLTGLLWAGNALTGVLPLWYLPLGLLAVVPVAAHLTWVHRGYHVDDDYVITRRGFWRRRTTVVPYDRVQTVFSTQSLFQRRRDLGSVTVDTAGSGGFGSGDAVATDVDAAVADDLRELVADRLQGALYR